MKHPRVIKHRSAVVTTDEQAFALERRRGNVGPANPCQWYRSAARHTHIPSAHHHSQAQTNSSATHLAAQDGSRRGICTHVPNVLMHHVSSRYCWAVGREPSKPPKMHSVACTTHARKRQRRAR